MFALKDLLPPFAFAPDALPKTSYAGQTRFPHLNKVCAGHTRAKDRLPRQAPATSDVFDMRFEGVWMSVA